MHTLPLPFAATTLWPTASGLLLQNAEEDAADGNGAAPSAAALNPDADLRASRNVTLDPGGAFSNPFRSPPAAMKREPLAREHGSLRNGRERLSLTRPHDASSAPWS